MAKASALVRKAALLQAVDTPAMEMAMDGSDGF